MVNCWVRIAALSTGMNDPLLCIDLSDGAYEKSQNEKRFENLQNELSQLRADSSVKIALLDLCDALESLSGEFDYYKQWI